VLVVVGIILLLVAIGVITFGALDQSGKATKTALANCQAMLSEFQAQTNLKDQPPAVWRRTAAVPTATGVASLWREPAEITGAAEGNGNVNGGEKARYGWAAVWNTQLVYQFLNRLPSNKQIVTRLPAKQVLSTVNEDTGNLLVSTARTGSTPATIDPPLILDAWGNPIIFVGSDGLAGVTVESRKSGATLSPQRVTSAGLFDYGGDPYDTTNLPRNRRPFFASAGPDGDFKLGDDNVYSFEQ
jgi:hypothetical protein